MAKSLLSDAIADFELWRRSQDLKKNTLRHDRTVLRHFLANVGNIWVHSLTERHVTVHFTARSRTCTAASLRVDHATLSKFFSWCRHTRRMPADSDPLFGRKMGGQVDRERHRIHVSKFPLLLDTAEHSHPRNRALVAVLLYSLLRGGDAGALRVSDLDLDAGYLKARISKVRGEDRLPILGPLDREMRRWLTHYSQQCGPLEPQWYLLPARVVTPIKGDCGKIVAMESKLTPTRRLGQVSEIVNPFLARIGVPLVDEDGNRTREGGHTLRRSGARALVDALAASGEGYPLEIVQGMLGHKSVTQTERYVGWEPARRRRDELLRGAELYPEVTQMPLREASGE